MTPSQSGTKIEVETTMSTAYAYLESQARWLEEQTGAQWEADREELKQTLWILEDMYHKVVGLLDKLVRVDREAAQLETASAEVESARSDALESVSRLARRMRERCQEVQIDRFETEIRPAKLKQIEGLCRAMLAGVPVGRLSPNDVEGEDLVSGTDLAERLKS